MTLSPLFCTTEIGMCHLSDTILNSSEVPAALKHDWQLSALTSPSAFNWGQGSSIMGETGTNEAVIRDAGCPADDPCAVGVLYMGQLEFTRSSRKHI